MKVCKKCGEEKPEYEFFTRSKKDGSITKKHSICVACRKECNAEYYKKNRQKLLDLAYQYRYAKKIENEESAEEAKILAHTISIEDAYITLATEIVRREMGDYRNALQNYDGSPEALSKIQMLEREIYTSYYEILTMGVIDLKQYCKDMRKKHNIPIV